MKAVVQRVKNASVIIVDEKGAKSCSGSIGKGLLLLLGIARNDGLEDVRYLVDKIVNLRIFEDEKGKMNLSLLDTGDSLLIVSQFTIYGDTRKGRRPGFDMAAPPEEAKLLYEEFVNYSKNFGIKVETGVFQAYMQVELVNDGPVTFIVESKQHPILQRKIP